MKQADFMAERITEDAGADFAPARYGLKSKNDAIVSPYATYDLFFEITFQVLQKLGAYEDIGTPGECQKAMEAWKCLREHGIENQAELVEEMKRFERLKKHETQCLDDMGDPLEPLKISSALNGEIMKFEYRKEHDPKKISILDYTIMAALVEALEKRTGENGESKGNCI